MAAVAVNTGMIDANDVPKKIIELQGAATGTSTVSPVLTAGTATKAPLTFTAGTNLTTAAAGTVEFDGTLFYANSLASSRQVIETSQTVVLVADHDLVDANIASATPMFVVTGAATGAVTLAATTTYCWEELDIVANTGTTSHTWSSLYGGTVGVTKIAYIANTLTTAGGILGAGSQTTIQVATAVVVTGASTSATEVLSMYRTGLIVTSTAGTFIPSLLASARPGQSGTPAVTAKAGSFFSIWPAGSATATVVGNWS